MNPILLPFPADRPLANQIAGAIGAETGQLDWHHFPDGESLVTIEDRLFGRDVVLVVSLRDPDRIAIPLRFAADTAREFGARSVGLIAPYLAYMRQDERFHAGEAVSARLFARFLQESVDWLVTADPHLHRNPDLAALFTVPVRMVATAPLIADWIARNVVNPVLIGPDSESGQWVEDVAIRAGAPYQVLEKTRRGDREVEVSLPDRVAAEGHMPVVVDDIVSSGRTVIETLGHLRDLGMPPAVCVVIHPVFAGDAYRRLLDAGPARVVSTDSIPHPSNGIPIAGLLASGVKDLVTANRRQGAKEAPGRMSRRHSPQSS